MNKWPERERPRERLKELGASALSDAELLGLVMGTGVGEKNAVDLSRELLAESGGLSGIRGQGLGAMGRIHGVGDAKAARVLAAIELGIRIVEQNGRGSKLTRFECSVDIFESYRARLGQLPHEIFLVVGLNAKNEVIKELTVAVGSINECRVEPSEVFRPLIAEAATRAVLLHNHPSGDATPSPEDVALTKRLVKVGELVGIKILDHLVVSNHAYSSLRDLGLFSAAGH